MNNSNLIIVGGGLVGLATGWHYLLNNPSGKLTLLEKEDETLVALELVENVRCSPSRSLSIKYRFQQLSVLYLLQRCLYKRMFG